MSKSFRYIDGYHNVSFLVEQANQDKQDNSATMLPIWLAAISVVTQILSS